MEEEGGAVDVEEGTSMNDEVMAESK